jgi:hypothetical protein
MRAALAMLLYQPLDGGAGVRQLSRVSRCPVSSRGGTRTRDPGIMRNVQTGPSCRHIELTTPVVGQRATVRRQYTPNNVGVSAKVSAKIRRVKILLSRSPTEECSRH